MSARSVERAAATQYVGRYRILAPIGIGSSATVYRALDEDSASEVAVKVLADNYSLVPEMRRRFLDEITLLMSIRSPAVAQVYGHGETETGQPFMVLELADRGDLKRRVASLDSLGPSLTRDDVLSLAEALAMALTALHEVGIVHRDVSPGNILISTEPGSGSENGAGGSLARRGLVLRTDERYLLADLGFAKDMQHASGLTAGGGTRGFAAPEQRQEVAHVDHRVDVFGATAVIDWLLGGSGLRPQIELFLQSGMSPDPDRRHGSMEEWLAALRQSLDRRVSKDVPSPTLATLDPPVADLPEPAFVSQARQASLPTRSSWRKPLTLIGALLAGGLTLAALAVLGGFVIGGRSGDQPEPAARQTLASDEVVSSSTTAVPSSTTVTALPSTTAASSNVTTATVPSITTTVATSTVTTTTVPTTEVPTTGVTATTVPTTGVPTIDVTITTRATTEVPATTVAPPTTATVASTSTTIDPRFQFSPRAFVTGPAAESSVSGALRVTGTANYRDGITGVNLVIRREADKYVWSDSTQSFNQEWSQSLVAVTPAGSTEVTWSYVVPKADLEPGRYLIRVWAVGTDASDPISDQRFVTVTG